MEWERREVWKKQLRDHGIATPARAVLEAAVELDRFLAIHPTAVIRPERGAEGQQGVARVRLGELRTRDLFEEARVASTSGLIEIEEFVAGVPHALYARVVGGTLRPLALAQLFSMRHLRGTLPTGIAFGAPSRGVRSVADPLWSRAVETGHAVASAVGAADTLLAIELLDDGDTFHVTNVAPRLSPGIEAALRFAGLDPDAPEACAPLERGIALRLVYANDYGSLERQPSEDPARTAPTASGDPVQAPRPAPSRLRIDWLIGPGGDVARPAQPEDAVVRLFCEAEDRNAAWMRANEIEADALFRVLVPPAEPAPVPPTWPGAATRASETEIGPRLPFVPSA